ncbi:MAG: DUF4442 domain-containing protein [Oligoflexia bacterium]|nr:DUF4442 domain-containing protein [Oligoflexia bacterium]
MKLLKETFILRTFGLLKIPMIFFLRPSVVDVSEKRIEIKIPLSRRSKNHLNGMYFGALSVGADCAGGILALRLIHKRKEKISLIFKDFKADFLKRAEADVHFSCEDGDAITELVERAIKSGERENLAVNVTATTPKKTGKEPIARFVLTLSLKKKA